MLNLIAIPTYFTIGTLNVALLDVISLVILLIFLIVGIVQGFMKQILVVLGSLASLILAFMLCSPVAEFVVDKNLFSLATSIEGWITGLFGATEAITQENLPQILSDSSIPVFLHEFILEMAQSGTDVLQSITSTLTLWILTGISFIVIFILAKIVFFFVKKLFEAITNLPIIGTIDKVLGAIYGVLKGLIIIVAVVTVLSLMTFLNLDGFFNPVTADGTQVTCLINELIALVLKIPAAFNIL